MNNVTIDRSSTYVLFVLLLYFLLAGLQIVNSFSLIFGLTFFGVLTLLLFLRMLKGNVNRKLYSLIIPFILFQGMYIFNYSSYTKPETLGNITYQGFFFLLMFILASIKWKKKHIKIFSSLTLIIYPILGGYILTDSTLVNPNVLGGYAFLLTFFPLLFILNYSKRKIKTKFLFLTVPAAILMWKTGARSILIAVLFIFITYRLWNIISRSKTLYNFYFLLIMLFSYGFTIIYPRLNELLPNFPQYEYWMMEYTGKRILSGRDYIWRSLADVILTKPWFGFGSGAQSGDVIITTLSAHNLYLQIALQVGLVGLILFIVSLYCIWRAFWNNRYDKKVMLSASFFIGIIVYQIYEVSLTQNNLPFSLLQWTIIGMGISYSLNSKKTTIL